MKVLIPLAITVTFLLVYSLWGRDWLKSKPWAWSQAFFAWVEPIEIFLFKKSPTILFARTLTGLGGLLTFLQNFNGVDITPVLPLFPEKYHGIITFAINSLPLTLSLIGGAVEWLRVKTTLPVNLIAVPDKIVAENPKVAVTIAAAVETNEVAIAAIDEAKAEAKVV